LAPPAASSRLTVLYCNLKYQDQATGKPSTLLISNYRCDSHSGVFTKRFFSFKQGAGKYRMSWAAGWLAATLHSL